jgi:hypothetical protein
MLTSIVERLHASGWTLVRHVYALALFTDVKLFTLVNHRLTGSPLIPYPVLFDSCDASDQPGDGLSGATA